MPSVSDWKVPSAVQPKLEDYGYDLERALSCVVGLHATIPSDAFTADTLGTERAGNGVFIRGNGLVLTIGYLVTEAENIWIALSDGRSVPGHVLGYDQESGFGLVQALAKLDVPTLPIGDSAGRRWASVSSSAALAGGSARSRHALSPSRNSPAIGNTCSTRRSSPHRRTRIGAEPRSSTRPAISSASVRYSSSTRVSADKRKISTWWSPSIC